MIDQAIRALIVDDEPLARAHLRRSLEAQRVAVIGEAEDAPSAIAEIEERRPDLVLADVRMPGLSGTQMAAVLQRSESRPLLIFVTGFSEHAATAFDLDAIDYLVKPVSPERLARALARVRERLAATRAGNSPSESTDARLAVREDYSIRLIPVADILYARAHQRRVRVVTEAGQHLTNYTLTELQSILPRDRFLRIHDSCIVSLGCVQEILFLGNHSYEVRLNNGDRLPVGRTRYAELQNRLGLSREN